MIKGSFEAMKRCALDFQEKEQTFKAAEVIREMEQQFGEKEVQKDKFLKMISHRNEDLQKFLSTIEHDSWVAHHDEPELKVFYRPVSETASVAFLIDGVVTAPLKHILAVLNEIDLYNNWIPFYSTPVRMGLQESIPLARLGRVDQIAHFIVAAPWPWATREVSLLVHAADDLKE
eukprot:Platyproteum_vivax@DN5425_c0_g1_i1.p1